MRRRELHQTERDSIIAFNQRVKERDVLTISDKLDQILACLRKQNEYLARQTANNILVEEDKHQIPLTQFRG